ncbi:MAG: hypothetical protein AAGA46_00320 [Cyanobacteria bacterium P01_F01_bin.13]
MSKFAKYGIAGIVAFVILLWLISMGMEINQPASETERRTQELKEQMKEIEELKKGSKQE